MRELSPQEEAVEIHDEFMLESAAFKLAPPDRREKILNHIHALLDAYLDMWPELVEVESTSGAGWPD